jgi:hypothetical protein
MGGFFLCGHQHTTVDARAAMLVVTLFYVRFATALGTMNV